VAVEQYTFTHKEYTEYRERNSHNNKKIKHTYILKRYKQSNTPHQLFVKHTKTETCFGFINQPSSGITGTFKQNIEHCAESLVVFALYDM
jgi:hypothetical protein